MLLSNAYTAKAQLKKLHLVMLSDIAPVKIVAPFRKKILILVVTQGSISTRARQVAEQRVC